ncbi:unnamed protein product [Trypanosoma congolense IL3000]|nr:unnamed protein product [Trypanosoma congolense IL3000]
MEWNVVKPMPKENGKICQDTDDHTNHSCTVWEGWVADYKKTTDLMKKLGGAERRARRARLQGEVEVIGLYKIYQALRAGEESDVIELLLEEAEEKRMLANEAELVSGVLVTRGSDKMSLERDKDLKLLKQARTETPKGMSWTMVAMISSLPVGLALMVYIISRFRKMPENGKDDLISPTCSCSLTNVGVEGDLVKK